MQTPPSVLRKKNGIVSNLHNPYMSSPSPVYRVTNRRHLTIDDVFFCHLTIDEDIFRFLSKIHLEREAYIFCNMKEIEYGVFESEHFTISFRKDGLLTNIPEISIKNPNTVVFGQKWFDINDLSVHTSYEHSEETVDGFQTRLYFDIDHSFREGMPEEILNYLKENYGHSGDIKMVTLKNNLFDKYHLITNLVVTFEMAKKISVNIANLGFPIDTEVQNGRTRSLRAPYCQKFHTSVEEAGFYIPVNHNEQLRSCYITPAPGDVILKEGLDVIDYPKKKVFNRDEMRVDTWCKGKLLSTEPVGKTTFVEVDGVMTTLLQTRTRKVLIEEKEGFGLFAVIKEVDADGTIVVADLLRTMTVVPLCDAGVFSQGGDTSNLRLNVSKCRIINRMEHPDGVWFKLNTSISDSVDVYIDSTNQLYRL
jgi:hypothetical protein